MDLKGASCVLTGAAGGIGAALAREFAQRGANVMLSDIDGEDLQALSKEIGMPAVHCDVTKREDVAALGRAAADAFGKIDIWTNIAGLWMPYLPAEEIDFDCVHKMMEVNFFGFAYGMVEAMKHMRPRGEGVIMNMLSVRSLKGKALGASYSATKFAAEGFTQAIRDELAGSGVAVIGIYPYRIKTGLFGEHKHEDYEQSMEPKDVANIIADNLLFQRPSEHLEIWSTSDIRREYR